MVSAAYRAAVFAPETDEVELWLVELTHPALATPVRVVNDSLPVTSQGLLYEAGAFRLELPEQDGPDLRARLSLANVVPDLVLLLRGQTEAPKVSLRVVLADSPDVVEEEWPAFELLEVRYDASALVGELGYPDLTQLGFGGLFLPSQWTGLQ